MPGFGANITINIDGKDFDEAMDKIQAFIEASIASGSIVHGEWTAIGELEEEA